MRRYLIAILLCLITSIGYADTVSVDSLVTSDDLTLDWLNGFKNTVINALNSFDGENIQDATVTTDELDNNANPEYRWGEAFNEFVYSGLLPPTSTDLTATTTAGTAYIEEDSSAKMKRVVKDATAKTYTASKDTYVDLSWNGTYTYSEVANGAAAPSVAANSIRLAKVVTDSDNITSVTDLRVTGVQLSTNEDYQLEGFELYWSTANVISVDAGVLYNGATRVKESAATTLNITTAADYINGSSEQGTNKWLHIYEDNSGNTKLDDNAPDYADTSGNTIGILRYFKNGSDYWRYIGSIRLNATGSGQIDPFFQQESIVMLEVPISETTTASDNAWSAAVDCSSSIPPTSRIAIFGIKVDRIAEADTSAFIRPNGSSWSTTDTNGIRAWDAGAGQRWCMIDASQNIQVYTVNSDSAFEVTVQGYVIRR